MPSKRSMLFPHFSVPQNKVMLRLNSSPLYHVIARQVTAQWALISPKSKISNSQARGIITHNILNIPWEAVGDLGVDVEREPSTSSRGRDPTRLGSTGQCC